MPDLSIFVAIAAIIVTAAALVVDAIQTRSIRKINAKVEAFQASDIGEQLGEWLLTKEKREDGSEITNLESCAALVGHQIAGSFKMGIQGVMSGNARTVRSVESKLMNVLQPEEMKAFGALLNRAGIPEDLGSLAYQILEQKGLLPKILKNNGQEGSDQSVW